MGIVFFGSGPVAATSLASLARSFDIEYVITKKAPVHHRGNVPVQELSDSLQLRTETANTRTELDILLSRLPIISKLGVIVDYGVIVSRQAIDTFPLGIVNSHFSLLPEWRGADPITFTVLSGQKETGVSLMLIVEALDEGKLLAQESLSVAPNITTPVLTSELIEKSNQMLLHYLPEYIDGEIKPYHQPDRPATYSRKLTKEDGIIDWNKPAAQIEREIRAFIEWPKSRTTLASLDVIITAAEIVDHAGAPGTVLAHGKELIINCGLKSLKINRLKPAGKKEMTGEAFLAGYKYLLNN